MDRLMVILGRTLAGGLAVASVLFLTCLVGTVFGALAGTVVGWVMPSVMQTVAGALGATAATPWQLGGALGFIGGFFRARGKTEEQGT